MSHDILSLRDEMRAEDRRNLTVPVDWDWRLPAPSKTVESLAWIIAMESPMRLDVRVTLAALRAAERGSL